VQSLQKRKVKASVRSPASQGRGEGSRVGDLEKRLAEALKDKAEALEQQTATADILRVISRSPSDIQPVFDAIVQNAVKLCEGLFGTVLRLDGDRLHLVS
jgi:two-component system, NtrC family, sensor kinase